MIEPLAMLGRTPMFAMLAEEHREQIAGHLEPFQVAADVDLAQQGEVAGALHIIATGSVGTFVRDARCGFLQLVGVRHPGEVFDEGAIFRSAPYAETFTALEATTGYQLAAEILIAVAGQVPEVAIAAAAVLGERLEQRGADGQIPWVSLVGRSFDLRLWAILPDALLRDAGIVPLEATQRTLTLGMVDPQNSVALGKVARALPGMRLRIVAVERGDFQRFVDSGLSSSRKKDDKAVTPRPRIEPSQVVYIDDDDAQKTRGAVQQSAALGPVVVGHVSEIISAALAEGASDIHIEPDRRGVGVRFRIDGALRQRPNYLPSEMARPLASRLKLLARLDITETRRPQEGRISVKVGTRLIDLRLSALPAKLGEKIVLRVLEGDASIVDLKALFQVDAVRQLFSRLVARPHGLVMVTGPTGSGKTTTLYSALNARRAPELNVVTVEDPIEYHLDGITQIQVAPEIGLTFAVVLRSLLRQDPDVVLVGETRDAETAHMATEAAMTGHLVLTSAHSNGAIEAVQRLLDLGMDRVTVASSLLGVLHQHLVRRICIGCAEPFDYAGPVMAMLTAVGAVAPGEPITFKRGKGCERCAGSGFKGRVGVYELLLLTEPLRDALIAGADRGKLHAIARSGALYSLARYAGQLLQLGVTVPSEVLHLVQRGDS